jgi:hypothetical protein
LLLVHIELLLFRVHLQPDDCYVPSSLTIASITAIELN